MKVLLIAPTCDRDDVGEAWGTYQWVHRVAARHDATVLTYHKRGRDPAATQLPGVRVVEWVEPPLVGRAERLNSMLKPGYVPFYVRARPWIKAALRNGEHFDLAHQVAPVAMRYPSPAAALGLPLVIGPVGGSLQPPDGFDQDAETTPWYVGLRSLDRARLRWDPLLGRTYDEADCVLGQAPYVSEILASRHIRRFEVMNDYGIDSLPALVPRVASEAPVRLLYVGRIVRTKGLRDAIRALQQVRTALPPVLDVVGDGFDRAACEALVTDLGLSSQVRFHGSVPREEVDKFYRAADVFVFPSYQEPGGHVVFEAMGFALPSVVSDRGGPGNVIDENCGIRVHPDNPDQFARELAVAITRLVEDPALRARLGNDARTRVAKIAIWDAKIDWLDSLYAETVATARARLSPGR